MENRKHRVTGRNSLRDKISGCSCSIYSRQLASDRECTYTVCRNYEFKACGIFAANYA